jgi:hypothetical protein
MKKEYLDDYQAREREEFAHFTRKVLSNELDLDDRYPSLQRLKIVHQPIVLTTCRTYLFDKEKVWSQIPFAGTLLIPLSAYDKDHMLNGCGFDVNDIPDLIKLAKETGRVRFGLADPPVYFENMDYFEPIFRELEPPELLYMPHEALSIDPKTYDNFCEEFEALASVNFYNSWNEYFENNAIPRNEYRSIMQHRKDTFVYMKILGVEEVDHISNLLIDEPVHADYLLAAYECLIEPIFDPLKASKNFCLSEIQHYDLNSLAQKMPPPPQQSQGLHSFPIEIGRYIMKKITLHPSTYYGCIDVIQHYKQNELYKAFEALDKAIKTKKQDRVITHISELNEIMDNVWKDTGKVKIEREGIKDGISVTIGGVGGFASSLVGAEPTMTGLLAAFGFNAMDRALSRFEMSIGDKLVRLLNKQYLVNIYDFKERHNLG